MMSPGGNPGKSISKKALGACLFHIFSPPKLDVLPERIDKRLRSLR